MVNKMSENDLCDDCKYPTLHPSCNFLCIFKYNLESKESGNRTVNLEANYLLTENEKSCGNFIVFFLKRSSLFLHLKKSINIV